MIRLRRGRHSDEETAPVFLRRPKAREMNCALAGA